MNVLCIVIFARLVEKLTACFMYPLPLFPLNSVLFPGMPLKLHIFEERYKLMIGQCYSSGTPFGVALIRRGQEVGSTAEPFMIGCTAAITELKPLPGGEMDIVAVGGERFQIHSLSHDQPYLVGMVDSYPILDGDSPALERAARQLRPWVERYLQILAEASDTVLDAGQLPRDPLRLAYLAAYVLQIPASQKQILLTMNDGRELIDHLREVYRREVTLLRAMLTARESESLGPFSSN
jgi:Lon protease-like protein